MRARAPASISDGFLNFQKISLDIEKKIMYSMWRLVGMAGRYIFLYRRSIDGKVSCHSGITR